jgi:hypothetical protein
MLFIINNKSTLNLLLIMSLYQLKPIKAVASRFGGVFGIELILILSGILKR